MRLCQQTPVALSKLIDFPLRREYPIPSLKNEAEFQRYFQIIFDDSLKHSIMTATTEDWSEVGWGE